MTDRRDPKGHPIRDLLAHCECGCGQLAPIATRSATKYGWVKGQPMRYVRGHATSRKYRPAGVAEIWARCETNLVKGRCWVWQGARNNMGYGQVHANRRSLLVHRVSYEAHKGPIPDGLELDHLCRNPPCCNPDHLEAVTRSVNQLRRKPNGRAA